MHKKYLIIMEIVFFFLIFCAKEEKEKNKIVFTTVLPIRYIIDKIAGEEVEVYSLVEKNMDPHTFTITPEQMGRLSKATLFFTVGLEPEKSIVSKIKKISPNIKIVELGEVAEGGEDFSFNQEDVISEEEHTGEHIEGKHLHCRDRDPHIWTSLHLLKEISFVISKYLIELHPEKKDFFVSNREKIVARIDSIDTFLKSTLSPYKERKFFIVHPSFGYFAYDYGLVQVAVEVDGKEPSAKEMKKLLQIAKEEKPYFLFVEPQFSKRAASVIAREINCEIATVDPLAEDILSEIYNFGIALKRNFENVK